MTVTCLRFNKAVLSPSPTSTVKLRRLKESNYSNGGYYHYTYDPLHRLKTVTYSDGRSFSYNYDAVGNVLQYTQTQDGSTVTTTYDYDNANQLTTAQADNSPIVWQYVYDANGRLTEVLPDGNPANGAKRYTYHTAGFLVKAEAHDGSAYQLQAEMFYNGLGQRLRMTGYALGTSVTTTYVLDLMDNARPLSATSDGNTTYYVYGLGPIAEFTTEWSYSLPDGTNTPRQLTNDAGEITLAGRYTPWGDSLEYAGTGNFTFGYFGGLMDSATGLLYVGNGQYYDPATGRFLTRDVNPNSTNPYVPWNPIGAIIGPLGLVSIFYSHRKKGSKGGMLSVLLLLVVTVGITLSACTPDFPYTPEPPQPPPLLENTPIIDAPWVDEMDLQNWNQYPNSCGPAALYMFLKAEGKNVDFATLSNQLRQEQPGGYDGSCCRGDLYPTPTPNPNGEIWCNEACTSAEVLASVARKYYGLSIQSGDNWTRNMVHERLMAGHPVITLVRSEFAATSNYFGHFVLIRGLIDQGATVVVNDSYPGEDYWNATPEERQTVGEGRRVDWYEFDRSWASFVDSMDPLGGSNFNGHVRWAMAVK